MYKFSGNVVKGKGVGGTIGFPTANIPLIDANFEDGVYKCEVILNGKKYIGAGCYFLSKGVFEVHVLDFGGDLYGKDIEVSIVKKIRENRKFTNLEDLKGWISEDVKEMR